MKNNEIHQLTFKKAVMILEEMTLREVKMNYHPKSVPVLAHKLDNIRRKIEKHFHMFAYDYENLDDDGQPTVTVKCEECFLKVLTRSEKYNLWKSKNEE